ncbi:MAG: hypothetical protein NTY02_19475 [Acidobacteria bacterium]|nr:hypothetical protein [Acidobacteriota bacterium]
MTPWAAFIVGAVSASVVWLFFAAWLCDQREAAYRELHQLCRCRLDPVDGADHDAAA